MFLYPERARKDRVLPKNKIYGNAQPSRAMRQRFVTEIDQIVWRYVLGTENLNLPARLGVEEIQVFEIALKTGQLAPAMAASNAATLIMSAVFGAVILAEHLVGSGGNGPVGLVGLGGAVAGVIILAATPGRPAPVVAAPTSADQHGDIDGRHEEALP